MLSDDDRFDAHPEQPNGTGVLLLAGSGGRIESARAELLASLGAQVRGLSGPKPYCSPPPCARSTR